MALQKFNQLRFYQVQQNWNVTYSLFPYPMAKYKQNAINSLNYFEKITSICANATQVLNRLFGQSLYHAGSIAQITPKRVF